MRSIAKLDDNEALLLLENRSVALIKSVPQILPKNVRTAIIGSRFLAMHGESLRGCFTKDSVLLNLDGTILTFPAEESPQVQPETDANPERLLEDSYSIEPGEEDSK